MKVPWRNWSLRRIYASSLQLDGRVKTLHPCIHGGILARRDLKHHMDALEEHGIGQSLAHSRLITDNWFPPDACMVDIVWYNIFAGTFDVVVVNLYPFYDKVTSAGGVHFDEGIENIDIGGPAMIRAAAKVIVLLDMLEIYSDICCWFFFCWTKLVKVT